MNILKVKKSLDAPLKYRLNLVLDLDYTLMQGIVSKRNDRHRVDKVLEELLRRAGEDDHYYLKEVWGCKILYILKKHLLEFLDTVSKHFNIFLYSHGEDLYVREFMKSIDPEQKMINR